MRKETIISFFSITLKNLRVLESFLEDNAMGTGKAVCAKNCVASKDNEHSNSISCTFFISSMTKM
jgi:hypothetical protein